MCCVGLVGAMIFFMTPITLPEPQGFLWKTQTRTGHPAYLFGTIHVNYNLVWEAVPKAAQAAAILSDIYYKEFVAKDDKEFMWLEECKEHDIERLEEVLDFHGWEPPNHPHSAKIRIESFGSDILDIRMEDLAEEAGAEIDGIETKETRCFSQKI